MGKILGSKLKGDKVLLEVQLEYEEAVQLQGHMDKICIFSENVSDIKTNISTRGKNGATKYLLIPKELRKNLNLEKEIDCQKIDMQDKIIFIYINTLIYQFKIDTF